MSFRGTPFWVFCFSFFISLVHVKPALSSPCEELFEDVNSSFQSSGPFPLGGPRLRGLRNAFQAAAVAMATIGATGLTRADIIVSNGGNGPTDHSNRASWTSRTSKASRIENTRWSYDRLTPQTTFNTSLPVTGDINDRVQRAHDVFEDFVYFEIGSGRESLPYFRADDYLPTNIGPRWTQMTGAWQTVLVPSDGEIPVGAMFSMVTLYDQTPHTPGLFQFTTIDYSQLFTTGMLKVTHYSWLLEQPEYMQDLRPHYEQMGFQEMPPAFPAPGTLGFAVVGLAYSAKYRRR